MPRLNPTTMPQVSVTFRMSEEGHIRLLREVGECDCNVSAFVRTAVMHLIAERAQRRRAALHHSILVGQMDTEGNVHA